MNQLTLLRLAAVRASGFRSEGDMAAALLDLVNTRCQELLAQTDLSPEQRRGIEAAQVQTPQYFASFTKLIEDAWTTPDDKENLFFALIKMMDDMLSLGAVIFTTSREHKIAFSVLAGAAKAGVESGKSRRQAAEKGWKAVAARMAEQFRREAPRSSQDDVATEIAARWKGQKPPGHRSLKSMISEMERDNRLPRALRG